MRLSYQFEDFVCDMVRDSIKSLSLDDTRKVEQVLKVQINELCKSNKTSKKKNKKGSLNAGAGKGIFMTFSPVFTVIGPHIFLISLLKKSSDDSSQLIFKRIGIQIWLVKPKRC